MRKLRGEGDDLIVLFGSCKDHFRKAERQKKRFHAGQERHIIQMRRHKDHGCALKQIGTRIFDAGKRDDRRQT